jgi:uncharacterized protein YjfI (DUF2170 family)
MRKIRIPKAVYLFSFPLKQKKYFEILGAVTGNHQSIPDILINISSVIDKIV